MKTVTPNTKIPTKMDDNFFYAVNQFIESGLLHYANHNSKDLTQVFTRGPFAGWSERQVVELIRQLDENRKIYRLE